MALPQALAKILRPFETRRHLAWQTLRAANLAEAAQLPIFPHRFKCYEA